MFDEMEMNAFQIWSTKEWGYDLLKNYIGGEREIRIFSTDVRQLMKYTQ